MNTCKSVSKQRTLTPSRMNTYAKPRGRGSRARLFNLRYSIFDCRLSKLARKSFICRFCAECTSKSFIYRIYAFAPGCGGPLSLLFWIFSPLATSTGLHQRRKAPYAKITSTDTDP
jgi:hypothetical protein